MGRLGSAVVRGEKASTSDARERLISAAYDLSSERGVQAVGIDAIIERSGVARQTMYRHFASKQELVLAFLERREQLWTRDWLEREVARRASDPREQLLAIFDVFDQWFRASDFEGCSFINVLLEHPNGEHPVHRAAVAYLAGIRQFVEDLARQAGIPHALDFAREWHILMKGSIVAAGEGDREAAMRAKKVAGVLLQAATESLGTSTTRARRRPSGSRATR